MVKSGAQSTSDDETLDSRASLSDFMPNKVNHTFGKENDENGLSEAQGCRKNDDKILSN